jgi:hypothetical protein
MNRKLLSLSLSAGIAIALGACRDNGNNNNNPIPDMAKAPQPQGDMTALPGDDLSVTPMDMAAPPGSDLSGMMMQTVTTKGINLGNVADKTMVSVSGLVVTGVANGNGHAKSGKMKCRYYAFLQDPNDTGPTGIKLYASGNPCTPGDGGTCRCPYPPMSNTPLDAITALGQIVTVTGTVSVYAPTTDAGLLPATHEIDVNTVTVTGMGGMITPQMAANATDFAVNGAGYQNFESTLVTIKGPGMAGTHDNFGGFDFAGAHFAGDYDFIWGMKGAYPAANMALKSITGIADANYGGGIAPRQTSDFQQ